MPALFFCLHSNEPENWPKCSSEAAAPTSASESTRRGAGRGQRQSAATDEAATAANGKREAATEASRTASAGEATG